MVTVFYTCLYPVLKKHPLPMFGLYHFYCKQNPSTVRSLARALDGQREQLRGGCVRYAAGAVVSGRRQEQRARERSGLLPHDGDSHPHHVALEDPAARGTRVAHRGYTHQPGPQHVSGRAVPPGTHRSHPPGHHASASESSLQNVIVTCVVSCRLYAQIGIFRD